MCKNTWGIVMKQLPRAILFSFGISLCMLMITSIGSVVLTDGENAFEPREARIIFISSFVVSFVFFLIRLLRKKWDEI